MILTGNGNVLRCACGWPLYSSFAEGCTPGNCCSRETKHSLTSLTSLPPVVGCRSCHQLHAELREARKQLAEMRARLRTRKRLKA